jgi:hypothetical protein
VSTPRITWEPGPYASYRSTVGPHKDLLGIHYRTRREGPVYFLDSRLPGQESRRALQQAIRFGLVWRTEKLWFATDKAWQMHAGLEDRWLKEVA